MTSAKETAALAYLASWALTLGEVAATVNVACWSSFLERTDPLADAISGAEAQLTSLGGGVLSAPNWVSCMANPSAKLQGRWARKLKGQNRLDFLTNLSEDDRVDFRSVGGPGAGGFLEPPVIIEGEVPAKMPEAHFQTALRDRLLLSVCPPGKTCQHRYQDGSLCGQWLDPWGKHAKLCANGRRRTTLHAFLGIQLLYA